MPDNLVPDAKFHFTPMRGRVAIAEVVSSTEVTVHGGGGYIDPQYGGWISGPTVSTSTSRIIRTRIQWPNGKQSNIDLPENVRISAGDDITLLIAENASQKRWMYASIINHNTDDVFHLGDITGIYKYEGMKLSELFGRFLRACLHYSIVGLGFWLGVMFFVGLLLGMPSMLIMERLRIGESVIKAVAFFFMFGPGLYSIFGAMKVSGVYRQRQSVFDAVRQEAIRAAMAKGVYVPA